MAQKTLSELTTITEMGEGDMFLIESEGKIKRLNNSGNVCVIDLRNRSVPGQIENTAIYNELLEALDNGKTIFAHLNYFNSSSSYYTMFLDFSYISPVNSEESEYIYIAIIDMYFYPTNGYSPSDLYQPVNLIPDIVDNNNNNNEWW